jgi:tRNA(Ile)-lysidine synthase TilS/MesJ
LRQEKFFELKKLLKSMGRVLIAFSGGVDSSFLASVAHEVLGSGSLNRNNPFACILYSVIISSDLVPNYVRS